MVQEGPPPHPLGESPFARKVADAAALGRVRAARLAPEHGEFARRGADDVDEHAEHRRLPGAVRADEADDAAPVDAQVDAVDGEVGAVALLQRSGFDDGGHARSFVSESGRSCGPTPFCSTR